LEVLNELRNQFNMIIGLLKSKANLDEDERYIMGLLKTKLEKG